MKLVKFLVPVILITFCLQSCNKGRVWGIRGKGNNISETRNAGSFNGISMRCDAEVELVRDSTFSIEISAQKNILKVLDTKVENGVLIIDYSKRVWFHNKVKIIVHVGSVQLLQLSGSGNINVQNVIDESTLDIKISGSGNISTAVLNVQTLTAHVSGSGNIKIAGGIVQSEKFSISGSGNISSEDLVAVTSSAKISGSGNIKVNVTESLNADISGSGNVRYRGNPVITSNISGSGRVIHI